MRRVRKDSLLTARQCARAPIAYERLRLEGSGVQYAEIKRATKLFPDKLLDFAHADTRASNKTSSPTVRHPLIIKECGPCPL